VKRSAETTLARSSSNDPPVVAFEGLLFLADLDCHNLLFRNVKK